MINDSSFNSKYNSAAAFAGKGWILLKGKKNIVRSNKQELSYKDAAIEEFSKALEILNEEAAVLITMQTLLQERCSHFRSALSKQLIEKDRILGNYMKSLENAITVIKKSQRLIQIMVINDCSQTTLNNDDSGVLKRIISYNKIEQKGGKFCDIHLISPDDIYYHKSAIENCEKIAVIKENQKKFRAIYKQEKGSKLTEWIVDNPELSKDLLSLHNDGTTILDRDKHWKIYALIYEKIKSKNGYIRQNILTPLTNCINNGEYQVTFNDLIARQDCGTIDQAIETIDNAVCKNEPNSLFDKTINSVAGIPSRL